MSANTSGLERAKQGICGLCDHRTEHGPWTDEQIASVVADTGCDAHEFEDWCDDCFVQELAHGDVREAARLLGRPMRLQSPEATFQFLLSCRTPSTRRT